MKQLKSLQFSVGWRIVVASILVLGSTVVVGQSDSSNQKTCETVITDVVVVGAGIAGILATKELQDLAPELDVVLLEATNRIGGRVKKATVGTNQTIELGANWLHNEGTPLYDVAEEMDIVTAQTRFMDIQMYNIEGKEIPLRFDARLQRYIAEGKPYYKMLQAASEVWDENTETYDGSESVVSVMDDYGYKEQGEIDAYIRWWLLDYEFTYSDLALINFFSPDDDIPVWDETETLVGDPRGYESIIQKIVDDNNIDAKLNTRVTDIIYDTNYTDVLNDTYKVLVRTVDTTTNASCIEYLAQRVIVTVPVSVLRGQGYAINFQPPISVENLPFWTGQFDKVFFKFKENFWGTDHEYIAILRNSTYRYICNHWQNLDVHLPGSKLLFCILSDAGVKKYLEYNLTETDLLEPLRVVFGADVVDAAFEDVTMGRWDLDPAAGYGAYSSFKSGYTYDQNFKFWGGYVGDDLVEGEGYNADGDWIVHLSGTASCYSYYEQTDGAYYSGIRSARYLLNSLGYDNIEPIYNCEDD